VPISPLMIEATWEPVSASATARQTNPAALCASLASSDPDIVASKVRVTSTPTPAVSGMA